MRIVKLSIWLVLIAATLLLGFANREPVVFTLDPTASKEDSLSAYGISEAVAQTKPHLARSDVDAVVISTLSELSQKLQQHYTIDIEYLGRVSSLPDETQVVFREGSVVMPLSLLVFAFLAVGIIIGLIFENMRGRHVRRRLRDTRREAKALQSENDRMHAAMKKSDHPDSAGLPVRRA